MERAPIHANGAHWDRPLRLGVVAQEMEGRSTGVGSYVQGLLEGFLELGSPHHLQLYFRGEPFAHAAWADPAAGISAHFDRRPSARAVLWEQWRLPSLLRGLPPEQRPDALFGPAYALPSSLSCPGVVAMHDLSFEHLGHEFRWRERWRRRVLARSAARRASKVVVGTSAMFADLQRTYSLPEQRLAQVPMAVSAAYTPQDPGADRQHLEALGLQPPYWLYLGSILDRRRVDLLLQTFARVAEKQPNLRLVLAGSNRLRQPQELARWIRSTGQSHRVVQPGWVEDDQVPALYRCAELAFYLSTYEGYGLPPLEALACGTPTVVSGGLALDDLWPEYPLRVSRLEPEALQTVVQRASEEAPLRARLATEAPRRIRELEWRHAAQRWLQVMSEAANGSVDCIGRTESQGERAR